MLLAYQYYKIYIICDILYLPSQKGGCNDKRKKLASYSLPTREGAQANRSCCEKSELQAQEKERTGAV
jgi:hypothetical protein